MYYDDITGQPIYESENERSIFEDPALRVQYTADTRSGYRIQEDTKINPLPTSVVVRPGPVQTTATQVPGEIQIPATLEPKAGVALAPPLLFPWLAGVTQGIFDENEFQMVFPTQAAGGSAKWNLQGGENVTTALQLAMLPVNVRRRMLPYQIIQSQFIQENPQLLGWFVRRPTNNLKMALIGMLPLDQALLMDLLKPATRRRRINPRYRAFSPWRRRTYYPARRF